MVFWRNFRIETERPHSLPVIFIHLLNFIGFGRGIFWKLSLVNGSGYPIVQSRTEISVNQTIVRMIRQVPGFVRIGLQIVEFFAGPRPGQKPGLLAKAFRKKVPWLAKRSIFGVCTSGVP